GVAAGSRSARSYHWAKLASAATVSTNGSAAHRQEPDPRVIGGNVLEVPLADESMDAVVSQEAFCHVPHLKRALVEACRILRKDGRLAFTDWIANERLSVDDAQLMWDGM